MNLFQWSHSSIALQSVVSPLWVPVTALNQRMGMMGLSDKTDSILQTKSPTWQLSQMTVYYNVSGLGINVFDGYQQVGYFETPLFKH